MLIQATQPRIHLASSTPLEWSLDDLYAEFEQTAQIVVERTPLSADDAWALAQFVDLADAAHGAPNPGLVRCAKERLSLFVRFNLHHPQILAMCGRAACMAAMAAKHLAEHANLRQATASLPLAA